MLGPTQTNRLTLIATRGALPLARARCAGSVAPARRVALARFALDAGGELLFAPRDARAEIPDPPEDVAPWADFCER